MEGTRAVKRVRDEDGRGDGDVAEPEWEEAVGVGGVIQDAMLKRKRAVEGSMSAVRAGIEMSTSRSGSEKRAVVNAGDGARGTEEDEADGDADEVEVADDVRDSGEGKGRDAEVADAEWVGKEDRTEATDDLDSLTTICSPGWPKEASFFQLKSADEVSGQDGDGLGERRWGEDELEDDVGRGDDKTGTLELEGMPKKLSPCALS
jgi:hypothetical protein